MVVHLSGIILLHFTRLLSLNLGFRHIKKNLLLNFFSLCVCVHACICARVCAFPASGLDIILFLSVISNTLPPNPTYGTDYTVYLSFTFLPLIETLAASFSFFLKSQAFLTPVPNCLFKCEYLKLEAYGKVGGKVRSLRKSCAKPRGSLLNTTLVVMTLARGGSL